MYYKRKVHTKEKKSLTIYTKKTARANSAVFLYQASDLFAEKEGFEPPEV